MNDLVRILALGLGAGVGVSVLQDTVTKGLASVGNFDATSKGTQTVASAVSAGVGVFAAEAILKAL